MVSVSRVYVPNHYRVFLSPAGPRAVRELRAGAAQGAVRLPARARAPGAARAHPRGRRSSSTPTSASTSASSASRPSCSRRPRRSAEGQAAPAPSAGDFGHTMVYSPDRDARRLEPVGRPPPGAARGRRPPQRAQREPRGDRPQPRVRHRAARTRTSRGGTPSSGARTAAGRSWTSGRRTAIKVNGRRVDHAAAAARATRSRSA